MRRTWWRWIVVVIAASMVAAACGGDDDDGDGGGGAEQAEEQADTSAVLRVAGIPAYPSIGDPTKVPTRTSSNELRLWYDSLLRFAPNGSYEPGLAESATVVDPTTIRIELREDVTFSDGTPFDADAVKAGIQRNIDSNNRTGFRAELFQINAIEVTSPTSLNLRFATPVAGAAMLILTGVETMVVSPAAVASGVDIATNPVGAGPFLFESYIPSQQLVVKKNPDYFDADRIKLAGIEFVPSGDPLATANGLRSGQIDTSSGSGSLLPHETAEGLTDVEDLEVRFVPDPDNPINMMWCKNRPPFDDVRVRMALNYGTDREALNEAVWGGEGEVAWGFFKEDDVLHDPTLVEHFAYDEDKAKDLLAEAGHANGLSFTSYVTPGDSTKIGEVLQQQWRRIGVDLTLATTQNQLVDFFQGAKNPANIVPTGGRLGVPRAYIPGVVGNVCQYNDPAFNTLMAELAATDPSDNEKMQEVWADIQDFFFRDQALSLVLVFPPLAVINNDRVGGVRVIPDALGHPSIDLFSAFVEAE